MALKLLKLQKKMALRQAALQALLTKDETFETRSKELEDAIEEVENDEDLTLIEGEVTQHETDKTAHEEAKTALENEIREIETELSQLENKEPDQRSTQTAMPIQTRSQTQLPLGGLETMKYGKAQRRAAIMETLNQSEVRAFYEQVRNAVMNKRALTGLDLTIPTTVLDRIQPLIGQFSKLYDEVEVITLNGAARAIVDGAIPEAIWTEMTDAVEELSGAFEKVELDGYKVGGFIPVSNSILEDSMIDLAIHLEDRIARSIGKALDKAILLGTGLAGKQPEGIIPAITAGAVDSSAQFGILLANLAEVDAGEEDQDEVIAVMNRTTYFKHIMPQTVVNTADGRQVVGSVTSPNMAGLRIVLVSYMPADSVLFGAFKKYMLGERKGVVVTSSTDVRFIEDQTVFKGTARYDGKPAKVEAFQLVKIVNEPAGA